jgi:hypothetical protein
VAIILELINKDHIHVLSQECNIRHKEVKNRNKQEPEERHTHTHTHTKREREREEEVQSYYFKVTCGQKVRAVGENRLPRS